MSMPVTAHTLALALLLQASSPQRVGPASTDSAIVASFEARVADYVKLHKKVLATTKRLSTNATPAEIDLSLKQISEGIRTARAGARAGDIFAPDIQVYFRRVLAKTFSGPGGADLRASILDENPIGTPVRVNGPYPDAIPLSTTPPQVIEALPKLAAELEYRFIGDRLILFDHHAHLIVDYLDRALPGVK